tara:strand:- start:14292 stop:15284 length:993 start_codon:yes stop_codon:yes gene_type:complete
MNYIYQLSFYAILSLIAFIFVTKISYKLKLVDIPNKRKLHQKPVAYTGGLALILSYIFSIYLFKFNSPNFDLILSMSSLIGIVGFIDDRYNLNVGGKLSLQIFPVIYLIAFENIKLIQIGDYNYFIISLGSFSIPFSILCVIFLINSFNYFDGLDGTLSFSSLSTLCILFFLTPDDSYKLFIIIILIPILIFLIFNFSVLRVPKLFLGDSGSLLIGFIIAFTIIYIANQKAVHPILLSFSISIFVYEFISINLIRLMNKKEIFNPGQDHLHHVFFKKYNSLPLTNFLISIINISIFTCGYMSFVLLSPLASLILFILFFIVYFILRKKFH